MGYPVTGLVLLYAACCLPSFEFVFDPETIMTVTTILRVILQKNIVRVCQGTTALLLFNALASLYIDRIILAIVGFARMIPARAIFVAPFLYSSLGSCQARNQYTI